MSGSLLDTSVLIASDETGALELPETSAISVISLGELHAGVQLAREAAVRESRRRRLSAVRAAFSPLPVDEPVAERYGEVLAIARSEGRVAKATALLIVATALATERRLHTLDVAQERLATAAGAAVVAL